MDRDYFKEISYMLAHEKEGVMGYVNDRILDMTAYTEVTNS